MEIKTNSILIYWKQGWWKTAFWVLLSLNFKKRIIWNVKIYEKDKQISLFLENMWFLENMTFDKIPWLVLFDEVGLNFNSKEWNSDKNKTLTKFFFLVRKFNLSSVFISQRFSSIPIDMRELATHIYEVSSIQRKKTHPLFKITRQNLLSDWTLEFYDEYIFDIISYLKKYDIKYDTLEASIIN